jgi:two-component system chemotaxis sensor kinase CheA
MGLYKQLEIDFDLDIVEDFVNHFAVMCENLEPLIIDLNKAEKYEDNIGELFRIFHNLKSAGGFLKLDPIVKLATLSEDVAEEARVVSGPASEEFIDWLLLISDQFEAYRQDIEQDAEYFRMLNPLVIKVPLQLEK